MSEKTAIETIRALRRNAENDMPEYDYGWDAAIDEAIKTLAALDAEKPAEEIYMVLLDAIFDAIKENGIMNHPTKGMFLTSESIDACLPIIQQYAESYHAALAAIDAEKPAIDDDKYNEIISRAREIGGNYYRDVLTLCVDIAELTKSKIDAEKPAEDAESCLSKMFRDIREIGYITEPLRLTNESHDACVYILANFAESYHAERCKECVGKLPAFPHRDIK